MNVSVPAKLDAAELGRFDWRELADQVLAGHEVTRDEALAILRAPDEDLLDILAAAYKLRRRWFGNTVQLYFLMNAKSGLCPEARGRRTRPPSFPHRE